MKKLKVSIVLLLFVQILFAQNNPVHPIQKLIFNSEYWNLIEESSIPSSGERQIIPTKYRTVELDINKLKLDLSPAVYRTTSNAVQGIEIELPNPDGTLSKYIVYKNTTMSPGLEVKFPEIRAYDVVSINSPDEYGKIDITPHGFHAMIFSTTKGTMFIDPYSKGNTEDYLVYYRKDFTTTKTIDCGVVGQTNTANNTSGQKPLGSCDLRTYRLAISATAEYTAFHGGTVLLAQAAQVTTMNRVNGIFERDAQITMTFIPNNNLIIYTSNPDPFTNGNTGAMINENQTNTDAVIGSANYDIGHIFGTNSGGLAQLQSPCGGSKARGVTGSASPVNDPFDIDYVAHEMGHQWGANHTQNNGCNRNNATAVEPGSASSIMGYAGICSPNVQSNSDDHFHGISVEEMSNFISGFGSSCAVTTAVTNSSPTITGTNGNITIPASTPFALTAAATDPNVANVLSYCWEQMDNQVSTQPPVSTSTGGPNFRSLSPNTSPTRYFPNLSDLMAGGPFTWEVLSSVSRTMNFRVTVRDNAGPLPEVGCIDNTDVTVTVDAGSGPFVESYPSAAGITWTGSTTETVTWNVAGTSGAPVSCANVDILLSTDGGVTFPTVLATGVPNSGSSVITVPNTPTITAVVMVICSNGTFFDISDNVFTIVAALPPPSTACIDTIYYPQSKLTSYDPRALMDPTGVTGVSQTYNANTGTIHGIRAHLLLDTNGIAGDAPSINMQVSVMNVDALNRPTTVIASEIIPVNDVGNAEQTLLFTAPVAVSSKYAVVVELDPASMTTDTAYYMTNNSTIGDGNGEGLMGVLLFGTWYNYVLQFAVYDADVLLAPIFEKTITASYTTDVDTACAGGSVIFTNTSTFDTDYMYNLYDSLNTEPYVWDYNDGTGTYNHVDTTYTFAAGGTYNTQLLITNYGYTLNCVDSTQKVIEILEPVVTASNDTALCYGDTVFLSATGTTTYNWDNGLGAGQNQTAVPLIDTMYVVTGTDGFGCTDTDTVTVIVNPLPTVIASNDTIVCSGGDIANLSASGATTYNWDNGLGAGQNQTVAPLVDTSYVVIGTDGVGCSNTDTVFVALAACNCVDTIYYPQSKLTSYDPRAIMDPTGITGVSQTYNANTGTIHGVRAHLLLDTNGIAGDASPINMQISVMNVDALNRPTTVIGSNIVTVNDVGNAEQTLFFTSPVAVSGKYAVVVELDPGSSTTDTAYYLTNNSTTGDGNGEGLMGVFLFGTWYNYMLQFAVYDADALIAPIFDKTITASYTTSADSICLGDTVMFTNTSVFDTDYMYNLYDSLNTELYEWNYDDGTGTYNHVDTTYTFAAGGTYNTQLLITNYGYTGNCVDSTQKVIEVIQANVIASVDTAVCYGDTVFLSATGAATYNWDNGLGAGQNQTAVPLFDTMYVVTGSINVSLGLVCTDTDTVSVTINPLPTVIASNDTIVCSGDTVFLSATGAATYNWDNGLGAGQNQTANPIVDTMYVVTGTGALGCSNTDTVAVTINALPTILASNDTIMCQGDTANISAIGGTSYTWDNGLGAGQSHQVFPASLTTYIVTGLDVNGCSNFDSVIVSINALPTLVTSSDTSLCQGDSVTLSVTGALTYTWDNGLGVGQTHLLLSPLDTAYLVVGVDTNGCANTDSVVITMNQIPNIIASNDTTVCLGEMITISVTGGTTYTWDNSLGIGASHDVTPTVTTSYIVTGDENGCIASDTVVVVIDNLCFNIPNVFTPNSDGKNDVWNIKGFESYPDINVKVFNRWGDLMFESVGYSEPWDGTYNGTESPEATYYYIIVLGDGEDGITGTINIVR
jgi:gliding motility-associated-like protein